VIGWDVYAKIRKLKAEGLSKRRVAQALGVSRNTIDRYWNGEHTPDDVKDYPAAVDSPEKLAMMAALRQYFEDNKDAPKKQRPNAKTAWVALRDKYSFGESTIRRFVRELKDVAPEAFIPLVFEPGEVMQVDWCEIKAVINGYMHKVPVFCAVLPYSYAIFTAVLPDMTYASFFEAHVMAFEWFGGVTARVFYDNLKTAVQEGFGKKAVKQERFKALESHYAFESVFMNKESGNEKGSVENLCGLCRGLMFTPIPNVPNFRALQEHAISKCVDYLNYHKVKDRKQPIRQMYDDERGALSPLPSKRIETASPVRAVVSHDMTFRFETTKYSLPMEYVGKTVTVRPRAYTVEAWCGGKLVFEHTRPFTKGEHQYIPEHYLPLLEFRQRAIRNAAPLKYGVLPHELSFFREHCPDKDRLEQLVNILLLARDVSSEQLLTAVACANKSGRPTFKSVCFYLKLKKEMSDDPIPDSIAVKHADLSQYDELLTNNWEDRYDAD
jgi:transposase